MVKTHIVVECQCIPLPVSHCPDIPDGKDMLAVKNMFVVRRPCVKRTVSRDSVSGRLADERSLKDTTDVRRRLDVWQI